MDDRGPENAAAAPAEVLVELAQVFASTLELQPLLKDVAQRTARAVGMGRCSIFL